VRDLVARLMNTTWTSTPYAGTDPAFRAWAKAISDALTAVGMVRVDASTSVATNWGTPIPGFTTTANTEMAWEVWAFPTTGPLASAAQTAAPVFIRIGYGTGPTASTCALSFKFASTQAAAATTAATGYGATAPVSTSASLSISNSSAVSWASCDGNGLALALSLDHSIPPNRQIIIIDRFRNVDGTVVTDGGYGLAFVFTRYGTNSIAQTVFDLTADEAVANTWSGFAPCITQGGLSATLSNLNGNNQAQVYPWWFLTKNAHGVSKMLCTYAVLDLVTFGNQQVTWLPALGGSPATRTIKAVGAFVPGPFDLAGSLGAAAAIWWSDP
jgi:hypothetical protein